MLSFPVGKIFHRGRLVGDFTGGSLAHEIVKEMLTVRDDLLRAEAALAEDSAPVGLHSMNMVLAANGEADAAKDEL